MFSISWKLGRVRWDALERLALLNPPGSEFDETRGMLSEFRSGSLSRSINFLVDEVPLFGSEAIPFEASVLELALVAAAWHQEITTGEATTTYAFRPQETHWRVEFRRNGDELLVSSNYQTSRTLRCSVSEFLAGIEIFLEAVTERLFVGAPQTLAWDSLGPLNRFLAARLSVPLAHRDETNAFRWSPDHVDWGLVRARRALNPPGSVYDEYGNAAGELFGAPLQITAMGSTIHPTARLRFAGAWAGVHELRKGQPREDGILAALRPGEPWPLLDLALQLSAYLRGNRMRGAGRTNTSNAAGIAEPTPRPRPSKTTAHQPVIDPSLVVTLEHEMGATGLSIAAREFVGNFVRTVHAQEEGATAWQTFRSLREMAF